MVNTFCFITWFPRFKDSKDASLSSSSVNSINEGGHLKELMKTSPL